jgi:hypothetical protein
MKSAAFFPKAAFLSLKTSGGKKLLDFPASTV